MGTSLDKERQKKAKQLARVERRLMVLELVLGGIYLLAWLWFGWSVEVRDYLLKLTDNPWLVVFGFAVVFAGIYFLISLPLLFYDGYVLPHRYGLSRQTLRGWILDQVKAGLLAATLALFLVETIYALLRTAPDTWWLWIGLVLFVFTILLSSLAPVLFLPIFYKFKPLGEEHQDLVARLMSLAERAQTRVEGVYQFDMSSKSSTANAALTGLGKTRRIILGDTLLDDYDPEEIETILAHELAHHVHRDIPIGIIIQSLITFIGLFLASIALDWGVRYFGYDGPADVAAMPFLVIVMGLFGLITMPLENAYSRWREVRADRYAVQVTGKGEAFASALTRLTNQNLSDADPEPWVEFFFYSHPATGKRIAMAKEYHVTHSG